MRRPLLLTKQRKAVLEVITESEDHPTAADIMERLNSQGHRFAYGTVYNSLKYLTEEGLVQELRVGDGACHYDSRTDSHCHIVCRNCHAIDEFDLPSQTDLLALATAETGYVVDAVTLLFEGLCTRCQESV